VGGGAKVRKTQNLMGALGAGPIWVKQKDKRSKNVVRESYKKTRKQLQADDHGSYRELAVLVRKNARPSREL